MSEITPERARQLSDKLFEWFGQAQPVLHGLFGCDLMEAAEFLRDVAPVLEDAAEVSR